MRRVLRFNVLAAAAVAVTPTLADPFASDWAPSLKSSARLVAGEDGAAGIEIRLSPHSITYWRDPGDAGAPPTFDFSGSANLKSAEVRFPAPRRIEEADSSVAFGYDADVLFPVALIPVDPKKPIGLKLAMTYAVCEKICLPARGNFGLTVASGVSSPYAAAVKAAQALIPLPVDAADVRRDAAGGATRLCFGKPLGAGGALFLEGPEGWRAVASADASAEGCFSVKVVERPGSVAGPLHARLTFVGASAAFETFLDLANPG